MVNKLLIRLIDPKILDLKFFAINYYVVNKNY